MYTIEIQLRNKNIITKSFTEKEKASDYFWEMVDKFIEDNYFVFQVEGGTTLLFKDVVTRIDTKGF